MDNTLRQRELVLLVLSAHIRTCSATKKFNEISFEAFKDSWDRKWCWRLTLFLKKSDARLSWCDAELSSNIAAVSKNSSSLKHTHWLISYHLQMRANIRLTLSIGSQVTPVGCPLAARSRSYRSRRVNSTLEGNHISWFSATQAKGAADRHIRQHFCCYEGIYLRSKSATAPWVGPICQVASVSCWSLMERSLESQSQVMWTWKEMMEWCRRTSFAGWASHGFMFLALKYSYMFTELLMSSQPKARKFMQLGNRNTGPETECKKDSVLFLLFRIGPKISPRVGRVKCLSGICCL